MRPFLSILAICAFLSVFGQASFDRFEEAYEEISAMQDGEQAYDLKRAVFLTENAFLDGALDYKAFRKQIEALAAYCKGAAKVYEPFFLYGYEDREEILLNAMVFKLWSDTITVMDSAGLLWQYHPFSYDFEDPFGRRDWTKMFVSKLLDERTGNCHSMPYLYKMIVEELGQKAHLALAPNHIYIKQHSEQMGMYNTELTSAAFPIDAWLMASGYIHLDAIRNGIYMDTLTQRQTLSMCLLDLAKGFERKHGLVKGGFVSKCVDSALEHYPNNVNALLLRSELIRSEIEAFMSKYDVQEPAAIMDLEGPKKVFAEYEKLITQIHQLGYRRMPEHMYNDWLLLLQEKRAEYSNNRMDQYLNTDKE